ncbi:large conductance mechanosensitive channel protein MscL [Galactobacter valiniphilus]|uniref:large conductance mechanosensitive channel protein MscL n=1 Tax=Galactobacter valiniphilus TaxID=2676122 RepID=UPI003735BFB2
MLQGFKDFITRGNVMDLAVGVIIGAAFGKIVDALVNSVLMPAIAKLVGEPKFDNFLAFGDIKFGVLLTAIVNFLLIALAVYFALVLPMNKLAERQAAKAGLVEEPEAVDPQLELLAQIRDELKANRGA